MLLTRLITLLQSGINDIDTTDTHVSRDTPSISGESGMLIEREPGTLSNLTDDIKERSNKRSTSAGNSGVRVA